MMNNTMPGPTLPAVFTGMYFMRLLPGVELMKLNQSLLLKLSKKYEPSAMVGMKFKGKDLSFKTDDEGNPIVLFIGKMQSNGKIKGERYTRTLVRDANGFFTKDHWDLKGKT